MLAEHYPLQYTLIFQISADWAPNVWEPLPCHSFFSTIVSGSACPQCDVEKCCIRQITYRWASRPLPRWWCVDQTCMHACTYFYANLRWIKHACANKLLSISKYATHRHGLNPSHTFTVCPRPSKKIIGPVLKIRSLHGKIPGFRDYQKTDIKQSLTLFNI